MSRIETPQNMNLRTFLIMMLFPWTVIAAGEDAGGIEAKKERNHARRIRPPVRRNIQKSSSEPIKEQVLPVKEFLSVQTGVKAQRSKQENRPKSIPKENGRRVPEQKKEKIAPVQAAQEQRARPASRQPKAKEKSVSQDRMIAAFHRASEVSSWGNGVFTFHENTSKRNGILSDPE